MASIKIISGANTGETYSLDDARETILGRHPDCQVVLKDSTVSRRHARFSKEGDHYVVDDIGSQHGTRVNGEIIRSSQRLYDRDEVQISQVQVVFLLNAEEVGSKTDRGSAIITSVDVLGDSSISDDSQTAPRWRALLNITRSLGVSLDLRLILPNVLENIFQILPGASRGCIMVSERPGEEPLPYAIKNSSGKANAPPAISRTIANTVLSQCKAVLSTDAGDDERFQASDSVLDLKIRSVLCAPLVGAADEALGMIHLDAQDPAHQFTSDDLDILVNIANLVGQAVDHARLHETQLQFDRRERDMETARQVQRHFLPADHPIIEGYQISDYYKPADAVGGDYFGYTELPDGRLAIAVGDVAGHGVPAALLMARLCSETRYCLVTDIIPSDAVQSLNQQLTKQTFSFFITFALCVLDPIRHELTVVNAGHMPPLLRRARTGEVEEIAADISSPPLGIDPGITYHQATITLEPGDVVVMYTDGISECPSPAGPLFGIDRILRIVADAKDARSVTKKLLDNVIEFTKGMPQEDDTCIVAFSRNAE
ncbi:MAG: SpoIIE family protein phosphatase [Planctomycetota bacterium]|nr:SpoIIE family protein phosphatase [Planctomycetota bacterium]